jgi:S1-C subfamily serine protease
MSRNAQPRAPRAILRLAARRRGDHGLPRDHPGYGRVHGVWVNEVAPGSVAARFGLRTDDVITGVNRDSIESVADLTAELNDVKPPIALQVQREGRAMFLLVR